VAAFAQFVGQGIEHVHQRPGAVERRRFRADHQDAHGMVASGFVELGLGEMFDG